MQAGCLFEHYPSFFLSGLSCIWSFSVVTWLKYVI
jgi:hypothetical protein